MFSPDAYLNCKILIIDDEPVNVAILEKMLAIHGYR
jgi:CheY-like chemotaxis protein